MLSTPGPWWIVWWQETDDDPVRVRARNHEQAALVAFMRDLAKRDHHENVRDMTRMFVASAETGQVWDVGVKMTHDVDSHMLRGGVA